MITQEQVKDLGERLQTLVTHLHLDDKRIQIANEDEKTAAEVDKIKADAKNGNGDK